MLDRLLLVAVSRYQFRNLTLAEAVLVLTGMAALSVSRRTEAASATATNRFRRTKRFE